MLFDPSKSYGYLTPTNNRPAKVKKKLTPEEILVKAKELAERQKVKQEKKVAAAEAKRILDEAKALRLAERAKELEEERQADAKLLLAGVDEDGVLRCANTKCYATTQIYPNEPPADEVREIHALGWRYFRKDMMWLCPRCTKIQNERWGWEMRRK